ALSEVRDDWGPITGIIHGAGVLADKLIAEKTDDQARRVLGTKVRGLHALLGATAEDPLRLIGLFSSVAARSGNRGQSDYAMANEILNKVAWLERARRGGECVVKALGWGPWEGGMVTPELAGHFRSMGVPLIPLQAGAQMLVDEFLNAPPDSVELVMGAAPNPNGLGPAGEVAEIQMDLLVSSTSHPYLTDHSIEGTPVVPVVLALEWFARLAEATRPDLDLVGCRDLRVLRGIRLQGFENGGDRFILRCKQVSNGDGALLEMDLRSVDGIPHYRALADMERRAREPASFEAPDLGLEEWTSAVYGDPLFHGPEFQVIRSLDGVSTEGMQATMMGVREAGWSGGAWKTDAAALDGGLQLALLWTDHVLGGRSLPTSVKAYNAYQDAVPTGPVRCTLRGRIKGKSCTACDITFTTDDGSLVAELLGVETHRLPGQRAQA
ncbi:MAG: KR domain-containing protein, partial [Myxococcota bacterium]|nr:KR domain-containing protein [Myxococcota bacterium]